MHAKLSALGLATVLLGTSLFTSTAVYADGHDSARRAVRQAAKSILGGSSTRWNIVGRDGRRSSGYDLGRALGALGRSDKHHRSDYGSLGSLFGYGRGYGYGNGYGYGYGAPYRDYDRRHHDDFADAYRDVGIANAVVDLFGIAANASRPSPYAYAPAPAPAPCGHYERRQVVIQEGYYQEYRVWVQEDYDPYTRRSTGHYEIRRRWVPEVLGYRDVWVPD